MDKSHFFPDQRQESGRVRAIPFGCTYRDQFTIHRSVALEILSLSFIR